MQPPFILASGSPRREALLRKLDLPFEVVPSSVSEDHGEASNPEELVQQLALMKARDVAGRFPDRVVIGADTVVVLGEIIIGKPADKDEARGILRSLSGKKHTVFTGVALVKNVEEEEHIFYERTDVTFFPLEDEMIDYYVGTFRPLDKAGAYGIQDWSACFVEKIEGCYNNVVGFPLARFVQLLKTSAVKSQFNINHSILSG